MRIAALCLGVFLLSSPAQARDFQQWLSDMRLEAIQAGISSQLAHEALPDTLEPIESIIRLDRKQPEGGVTFEKYKNSVVAPIRIKQGRERMHQHHKILAEVSAAYKVPPQYIVALWGIETSYGRHTGGYETIPALATLAYEGRRAAYFRAELIKAMRIVDRGDVPLHAMKGSWAGAMGQCQFMPTSYEKYAQDFNGDGKRDIWGTLADVFASAAQYLKTEGWIEGEPWGVRVNLPKTFDEQLIGLKVTNTAKRWRELGVPVPAGVFGEEQLLSIVQSGGKGYKTYITGTNYKILMHWNKSTYFATSVGLLADAIKN